jgi:hypothetical protein
MKEFRCRDDVERARLPDELARVVRGTLEGLIEAYAGSGSRFEPDADGWTVLIEEGDGGDAVRDVIGGNSLIDAPLEGVSFEHGCFVAVWLANNQFGITLVIPDAPWLDLAVRARLMHECEGRSGCEQGR